VGSKKVALPTECVDTVYALRKNFQIRLALIADEAYLSLFSLMKGFLNFVLKPCISAIVNLWKVILQESSRNNGE